MKKILSYLLGFYDTYRIRILLAVVAAVTLATVYYLIKENGKLEERGAIATVEVEANKEGVKTGAKIDQRVISYDDDDLDRRLARFMRD